MGVATAPGITSFSDITSKAATVEARSLTSTAQLSERSYEVPCTGPPHTLPMHTAFQPAGRYLTLAPACKPCTSVSPTFKAALQAPTPTALRSPSQRTRKILGLLCLPKPVSPKSRAASRPQQPPAQSQCPAAQILSQDNAEWPKDERGSTLEPVGPDSRACLEGALLILAVGNGRQAGGGMELCPDAGDWGRTHTSGGAQLAGAGAAGQVKGLSGGADPSSISMRTVVCDTRQAGCDWWDCSLELWSQSQNLRSCGSCQAVQSAGSIKLQACREAETCLLSTATCSGLVPWAWH